MKFLVPVATLALLVAGSAATETRPEDSVMYFKPELSEDRNAAGTKPQKLVGPNAKPVFVHYEGYDEDPKGNSTDGKASSADGKAGNGKTDAKPSKTDAKPSTNDGKPSTKDAKDKPSTKDAKDKPATKDAKDSKNDSTKGTGDAKASTGDAKKTNNDAKPKNAGAGAGAEVRSAATTSGLTFSDLDGNGDNLDDDVSRRRLAVPVVAVVAGFNIASAAAPIVTNILKGSKKECHQLACWIASESRTCAISAAERVQNEVTKGRGRYTYDTYESGGLWARYWRTQFEPQDRGEVASGNCTDNVPFTVSNCQTTGRVKC